MPAVATRTRPRRQTPRTTTLGNLPANVLGGELARHLNVQDVVALAAASREMRNATAPHLRSKKTEYERGRDVLAALVRSAMRAVPLFGQPVGTTNAAGFRVVAPLHVVNQNVGVTVTGYQTQLPAGPQGQVQTQRMVSITVTKNQGVPVTKVMVATGGARLAWVNAKLTGVSMRAARAALRSVLPGVVIQTATEQVLRLLPQ